MEKSLNDSGVSTVPRFDGRELSRRIAQINGGQVRTVEVQMVGKVDVKDWIDGLNVLRNTPPSCKLRSKTRDDISQALL